MLKMESTKNKYNSSIKLKRIKKYSFRYIYTNKDINISNKQTKVKLPTQKNIKKVS